MKRLILLLLSVFFTGCNNSDINEREQTLINFSSACGGFSRTDSSGLQKITADNDSFPIQYRIAVDEYCMNEKLKWHYSFNDSILDIIHYRKVSNCGSRWVMSCHISGTTLYLKESDCGSSNERCNCVFDQFCSIRISPNDITSLTLADLNWNLNLKDTSGTIVLDTISLSTLGITLHQ